jgi:hypothetical protein
MSVKVPPRSIQKSQSCGDAFFGMVADAVGQGTMSGLSGTKQAC